MPPWLVPTLPVMTKLWVKPEGSPDLTKVKRSFTTDFSGIKISPNRIVKTTASLTEI